MGSRATDIDKFNDYNHNQQQQQRSRHFHQQRAPHHHHQINNPETITVHCEHHPDITDSEEIGIESDPHSTIKVGSTLRGPDPFKHTAKTILEVGSMHQIV